MCMHMYMNEFIPTDDISVRINKFYYIVWQERFYKP